MHPLLGILHILGASSADGNQVAESARVRPGTLYALPLLPTFRLFV